MTQCDCFRIEDEKGNLSRIGTVTVDPDGRYAGSELCDDSLVEDAIWNLCNWHCWMYPEADLNPVAIRKDGLLYERTDKDRGTMNSDLVIVSEDSVVVALPVGWKKFTNVQDAVDYRLNYEIPLFYTNTKTYKNERIQMFLQCPPVGDNRTARRQELSR